MSEIPFKSIAVEDILKKIPGKKYLVEYIDDFRIIQHIDYIPGKEAEIILLRGDSNVGIADYEQTVLWYFDTDYYNLKQGDTFHLEADKYEIGDIVETYDFGTVEIKGSAEDKSGIMIYLVEQSDGFIIAIEENDIK